MQRHRDRSRLMIGCIAIVSLLVACTGAAEDTTTTTAGGTTETGVTETTASEGPGTTTSPDGATTAPPEAQATGGRVVVAAAPPGAEGNNPQRDYIADDVFQLRPMYENLIGVDPETGEWVPELAESWEVEPDGMSLRFQLREGVQFHNDWGEFTAADVVHTYEDLTEPEGSVAGGAEPMRQLISEIEVVNDHEVVFRATEPSYSLFDYLSGGTAGMDIKSADDYASRNIEPGETVPIDEAPIAGTGPYQFVERTQGQNIVFEAVPYDHWRKNPEFQELELRWIAENSTRLSALLAGEIHVTSLPEDLMIEAENSGAAIMPAAIAGNQIAFNMMGAYAEERQSEERLYPDSPLNDVRVRQALNKAIDRDAIINAFYGGDDEPVYNQYFHPDLPGWDPQFEDRFDEMYGYDPDAARDLLAEAGYGPDNPAEIGIIIRPDDGAPELEDVMEAVGVMFEDVGVDVFFESVDQGTFFGERRELQYDRHVDYNNSSSEPITAFIVTGTSIFTNRGQAVEIPEIDEAYAEVLRTLDDDLREELWQEVGIMSYEAFQHIPLVQTRREFAVDPNVVSGWTYPGRQLAFDISHLEYLESAD